MTVGGGGLEWGAWVELPSPGETITTSTLCFFADIFENSPTLLPKSETGGLGPRYVPLVCPVLAYPQRPLNSWCPTLTLSIDFKFPIPRSSADFARRTVGLYMSAHFINDPQGRHDAYVEIWTAPCNIGEEEVPEGWRDKQVCLATGTQMAITVPMELNHSRGAKM